MYNFKEIEKKWQDYWFDNNIFSVVEDENKKKLYNLVEFPYPSSSGMHLGHIKAYMSMEVLSRRKRLEGYNVLFPIGFDSFGLPAENYAIKMGIHPAIITKENEEIFTRQLKSVGFSFDYDRTLSTTDPRFYKWTQWIFLKMFEHGLVYRDKTYINYCPSCKVTLANEDSQGGKCDRCGTDVILTEKDVWFLKITEYAELLLEGLDKTNYLPRIKLEQRNWIGKSVGVFTDFEIKDTEEKLKVYTTRPDTLFGVTFMVIAPEHPLIDKNMSIIKNMDEINEYRVYASKKSEFERIQLTKGKTGVKIEGLTAINPVNQKPLPIYISDYVMMGYGTGAIMAVPGHDERDYEFATKFNIPIIEVIKGGDISKEAYISDGIMINSEFLDGMNTKEAFTKMTEYLETHYLGKRGVQYKMKDWAFNRQRYWGEPIPIVHCPKCGIVPVPYKDLPLVLPQMKNFIPGENGESPLINALEWVNCKCPKCEGDAKRETDTMPQWAGSSWYYLRYTDPKNDNALADPFKLAYWMNVDWYNGGSEHITRHMIYARFWHKFLYDIDSVNTDEPFIKRTTTGLVLGSDGSKMSKSKGNTISVDEVIDKYGADVLRSYILFMGDYAEEAPWNDMGAKGIKRFIDRVWKLKDKVIEGNTYSSNLESLFHKTIKKVSEDIDNMKYNTAISALMILLNEIEKVGVINKEELRTFILLLYPFAPHITEEINDICKLGNILSNSSWPIYNEAKTIDNNIEIGVQINGKLRGTISITKDMTNKEIESMALKEENVIKHISGKEIVKVIIVPNRIVNIVLK